MRNCWHFFEIFSKTLGKNSKLKQNLEKSHAKIPKQTQKPATPVELNWRKIVQKKPGYIRRPVVSNQTFLRVPTLLTNKKVIWAPVWPTHT